jgi:plastocyanin
MASLPRAAFVSAIVVTVGVSIAAIVAAATSGDDSSSSPSATDTPAAAGAPAAGDQPAVAIANFAFVPEPITVKVGQSVTWTNRDPFAHSVKATDGSFGSNDLDPGATFSETFSTPGTYTYVCGIHSSMHGTVVVQP